MQLAHLQLLIVVVYAGGGSKGAAPIVSSSCRNIKDIPIPISHDDDYNVTPATQPLKMGLRLRQHGKNLALGAHAKMWVNKVCYQTVDYEHYNHS
ncbi:MAG: hypothetical protein Q8S19_01520 [Bacillota bacterium]|nr:hypothetical protein [Bacillota bacterium]